MLRPVVEHKICFEKVASSDVAVALTIPYTMQIFLQLNLLKLSVSELCPKTTRNKYLRLVLRHNPDLFKHFSVPNFLFILNAHLAFVLFLLPSTADIMLNNADAARSVNTHHNHTAYNVIQT